ncbi:reverse transcriptase domain-containing protein [Tanacetum coccineum]
MLFPFSIEGAAQIWLEKEPPRSILTWEDLVSKFINQFFPPSKTTNLRNEITNFQQKFEETLSEAWDHFKDLLCACPHHSFMELHQLDTFYNALNPTDQDSLNVAVGVISKVSANTYSSTTACPSEMAALTDSINAMLRHVKTSPSETIKAISESCVTYCGPHPYYECLVADGNTFNASTAATTYNKNQGYRPQGETNYRASNQIGPPGFPPVQNNQKRFNQNHRWVDTGTEETFYYSELLNDDSSSSLHPRELHFEEIKATKSYIDDPPKLGLKDLPSHLEYAFLKGIDKLPVIISKGLKDEENAAILKVLKSHKRAIAWKISDIKCIDPSFCTHKILMEDDFKLAVQHQRRVNPKIHEVIKKEVIKLLDAGLIYPIFDSSWVSSVHNVPKKGGMTVVENEDNKLIPTRMRRICRATHLVYIKDPSSGDLEKKEINEKNITLSSSESLGMISFS